MTNHTTTLEIGRQSEQELVGSSKANRWKKILIWSFVGAVAIAIIVTLSVVLTRDSSKSEPLVQDRPSISLEDFLNDKLHPRGFNAEWTTGDQVIYRDDDRNIVLRNVVNNQTKILISGERALDIVTYSLSPNEKYVLITRKYIKVFRHSFLAQYFVVDVATGTEQQIVVNDDTNNLYPDQGNFLLFALWNPNPESDGILFNYKFNLYYQKNPSSKAIQITNDGSQTKLNGICDWVYEEEIFASNIASWFSPKGNLMSFIQFNDEFVIPFAIPIYGNPGELSSQYTQIHNIPYPKVGTPNPTVQLFIVNLDTLEEGKPIDMKTVKVPQELEKEDHIISTVAWANDLNLVSVWMNRIQNHAIVRKCDASSDTCLTIAELSANPGWVELFTQPLFNKDGTKMAIIASQPQGDKGSFRHITIFKTDAASTPFALTKGEFVVTEIFAWNQENDHIYYAANLEGSSESKHIYSIKAEEGAKPECMTCSLDSGTGKYWDAEFSKDATNVVLSNQGPNVPRTGVYSVGANGKVGFIQPWEDNQEFNAVISGKALPSVKYDEIDLENGFTAKVRLQLPPNLDESKKYPMLVDVYGGPDSYAVTHKFDIGWGGFLVSNKSYIYAKIDGRGSGLRGDKLLHTIYNKLGTVEIEDQITTAKKLTEKYSFIDASKVGIWGWSYGGYASGQALVQDKNHVFQCAASVAPVTDWLLYDSIYTERYMGLPRDNLENYQAAQLDTKFKEFKDRNYLLIHGTRDDNVHFQQAMLLAKTLEKNDVLFREVSYPDEEHGLANVRPHLYHTLGHFFDECFGKAS